MAAANNAPADPIVLAPPTPPEAPPSPPPRPAPKTGVNRIAEMHAMRYEPNEVTVNEEGTIEDYGEYAEGLLAVRFFFFAFCCRRLSTPTPQDDAMLFITVRSASPADVQRVLQVVEQVRRLRHKRGKRFCPPTFSRTHARALLHRGKSRCATRRTSPIRRLRLATTRSTTYQARWPPSKKHIYASIEPNRTSE